jgi:DNA-binding MarR family transcriptional regulator
MPADALDRMLDEWRRERPDIDADGMAVLPRVMRLAWFFDSAMQEVEAALGLKPRWLDVLSALRRSGAPFRLPAGELAEAVLLSSGGMTARIDRMEAAGLVRRGPDPEDRRGVLVELTPAGLEAIDRAIDADLELDERVNVLSEDERKTFIDLLRKQNLAFEEGRVPRPPS